MGRDSKHSAVLRKRAERELKLRKTRSGPPQDALRLAHELQVHQLELEAQNEELRRASLEIEASMRRYEELFDFAPIGYVVLDASGVIHEANFEAARMLGVARGKLTGRRFHTFLAEEHGRVLTEMLTRILGAQDEDATREMRDVALSTAGVDVRLIASARAGAANRAMVALHDVSARVRAERALREESVRKDDFMAALSHELRNPLAPIRSSLAVLARAEPGGDDARRALAIAGRQLDHLVHIVDDLLDATRIARGKVRLAMERLDLGALVRALVDDHRRELDSRGITLEMHLDRAALGIDADRTRIAQVVGNLLGNAIKFTPRGGRIEVSARRQDDRAVLVVRDDGAGIAPEVREHLFEPFMQAPQTIARTSGGLGLGLAMVKGLVELHGGTVDVSSAGLGRGSRFTVRLPLVEAPGETVVVRAAHATSARAAKHKARRILIIDDNRDSADAMASLLELEGHEVRTAYDGATGLDLARDFRPQIVFCDLGLPEVDGYAVARAMRAHVGLEDAYLVALSGYARPEDRRRSAESGFDLHLAKPPPVEAIEHVIAGPLVRVLHAPAQ